MLEIARGREGGETVEWIEGDISALTADSRFDLAVMTGHVFQVFVEDEQALAVLSALRGHLDDQGRLAFESRNPAVRAWEAWTPARSMRWIEHPQAGRFEVWHDVIDVSGGKVTFETSTRAEGDTRAIVSRSVLAFRDRDEIAHLLRRAGFAEMTWMGGWDGQPFTQESAEIIVIAR